jgi:hypothetical protein
MRQDIALDLQHVHLGAAVLPDSQSGAIGGEGKPPWKLASWWSNLGHRR